MFYYDYNNCSIQPHSVIIIIIIVIIIIIIIIYFVLVLPYPIVLFPILFCPYHILYPILCGRLNNH